MIAPTLDMTYQGGPIEVLNQLIEKRHQLLKQSLRNAVVATAITALKSIRAQTKRYKGKVKVKKGAKR